MNHLAESILLLTNCIASRSFSLTVPSGENHVSYHLLVTAADAYLGYVAGVERQTQLAVGVVEYEVGYYVGRRVASSLGVEIAWFGVEALDLLYGVAELVLGYLKACHETFVMLLGECVEIRCQYFQRQPLGVCVDSHLAHLQQQTLLQVARSDAGRFKLVYDAQYALDLLDRYLDALREGHVVAERR